MNRVEMSKNKKKKGYISIGLKVGFVVGVMQMLSVVITVLICVNSFNTLITKMLTDRCTNGTNMLAYELSKLDGGEDMSELLDGLKDQMRCEFTIFNGNVRVYTTLEQDGQRMVGTKLSPELEKIVLEQGQEYVGETEFFGTTYLCSYVPTKGADGEINGLIFAGISEADAKQETQEVVSLSVVSGCITIFICVLLLALYLKKRVANPLGKITKIAQRMENGDLGLAGGEQIQVSVHSNDEIGMLGSIFEDTIRCLRSYIGEITDVLSSIASGNLTHEVSQDYRGDFQSIKESLDSILANLNSTMGQIAASAVQVAAGSSQVSGSSQALAQGATEQASAVQEISATIADISGNAKKTSVTAEEAGNFVNQAGAQLGVSMECAKDLNVAMEHISSSSEEINTIIATIENIAFQINILSLNATVEAARAGSAGKGFAVVADEVRNLSIKSDEAAKATKELIGSSINAVNEGSDAVQRVTDSLEKTYQLAGNVTSKMADVVEAVERQTMAISQVTEGVDQISEVVQTNAATSEECAAASQELSSQADLLKNSVSSFKLKNMRG